VIGLGVQSGAHRPSGQHPKQPHQNHARHPGQYTVA
jgi:hypothetical protein